ncbi:WXG100 family type VII secretion target [Streptomyces cellostaticus]|uniref:WXG100 family type VII secretion target n=1 Tax=Streptomyces cellostaticus TaxID=67285 RepID=UPI0020275F25|nr:hypothetical protein [Streptomyces cellostaticus]
MTDKQHEADLNRVSSQNDVTDFVRGVEDGPQVGFLDGIVRVAVGATPFGQAIVGRTDFGQRDLDLNRMLDLVQQTDPEDLESSGKALWDARDAIKAAADELNGHVDKVHWVGESGDAFREWGAKLITNTHHLSDFAGTAGDQITAAAVGLASVRGAMPERDPANHKRPKHFTTAEKAADKEGYAAAVKVEKDRQEAINQMNRLASYYAVSEEVLSGLPVKEKTPEFTSMPDVGVPRPRGVRDVDRSASATGSPGGADTPSAVASGGHHVSVTGDVPGHVTTDGTAPTKHVPGKVSYPDAPVGTNIDTVGTLPSPTAPTGTSHTPPVVGTPPATGGQPTVFEGPFGTPLPRASSGRGLSGAGNFRTPPSTQGRAGTSGSANPAAGRTPGQGPVNQMGRSASTGQSAVKGAPSGAKPTATGRGVTGGTPRTGGSATPRANAGPATGAGRSNGVVGGRPTSTGGTSTKGGSKIPRGTVIGGEGAGNSRPTTSRLGERGVFGAAESTARPGSSATGARGRTGASEAVTGRPSTRNSAAGAERNGMTRGGAGLVRGTGHQGKPRDEEDNEAAPRPDYLVEDEETHLPNKPRRDVPPVVD